MSEQIKTITAKQVLDLMCQIVGEYGVDYVYEKIGAEQGCYNWDREKGCPSCLIGHVVSRLGASDSFMLDHVAGSAPVLLGFFSREYGHEIAEGVGKILSSAQCAQDGGEPWGMALAKALTEGANILGAQFVARANAS